MKILGIDEAGRGCVLGSIFLCGIICHIKDYSFLKKLGIKDSKTFVGRNAKLERARISCILKKQFIYSIVESNATEIDEYVYQKGLNRLERKMACNIIDSVGPVDKVLLDGKNIFSSLKEKYPHSEAITKGDEKNLVIAAASILAKNSRDHALEKIYFPYQKEYKGEIKGNGYANHGSEKFVRWYYQKYRKLPCFYRKSYRWKKFI